MTFDNKICLATSSGNEETTHCINVKNIDNKIGILIYGNAYDENYSDISLSKLLDALKAKDYSIINQLHGYFIGVYYDIYESKVLFFTDRLGMMPAYYYYDRDTFVFADSIKEIVNYISAPLSIDYEGWAQFFYFGNPMGKSTYFQEIKRTFYDEWIELDIQGYFKKFTVRHFQDKNLQKIDINDSMTKEEVIHTGVRLLTKAVSMMLNSHDHFHKVLMLSGGWDSRFLAGLLQQQGAHFRTITVNGDVGHDQDQIYAFLLSKKLGFPNQFVDLEKNYYITSIEEYLDQMDFQTSLHVWMYHGVSQLSRFEHTINFDGLLGDRFLKGAVEKTFPLFSEEKITDEDFFQSLFYEYCLKVNLFDTLLTNRTSARLEYLAKKSLKNEIQKYEGHPNTYTLFLLVNRARRNIVYNPIKVEGSKFISLFPFLYNEFVDFILSVPPAIRMDSTLYPDILHNFNPKLLEVPSTNDRKPNKIWNRIPVYKHSQDVIYYFKRSMTFQDDISPQILNKNTVNEVIRKIEQDKSLAKSHFKLLEKGYVFMTWLKHYESHLKTEHPLTNMKQVAPELKVPKEVDNLEENSHWYEKVRQVGKKIRLDGHLDWEYFSGKNKDFIVVRLYLHLPAKYKRYFVEKNGVRLIDANPNHFKQGDLSNIYSNGYLYLSINDEDSSWGKGHQPTGDELKQYFEQNRYILYLEQDYTWKNTNKHM